MPLGSGAYVATEIKPGASIRMKRVADYWGKDLPVNVGQDNFDEMEYIYFRDANVAFEAFKGDQYDWRTENSSKSWATGYDFPGDQGRARDQGRDHAQAGRGHAGLGHEHRAGRSSRTCACARP